MANNCWNWVSIDGDRKSIETVINRMKDYDRFDNLTDWGNHIIGEDIFDVNKSVYDNIGTRWWDIDWFESQIEDIHTGSHVALSGDSAWGPPLQLLEEIAKHFNLEITIEFEEPGNDFGGYCKYNQDGLVEDHTVGYQQWMYEQDSGLFFEHFDQNLQEGFFEGYTLDEIKKEYPFLSEEDFNHVCEIFKDENLPYKH